MSDIIVNGVVKIKVKGRWRECLSYSSLSRHKELKTGGLITLDKKWILSCNEPYFAVSNWTKLKWLPKLQQFGFYHPDPLDRGAYTVDKGIIDAIDSILIERHLL